jgi:hypothetical protein
MTAENDKYDALLSELAIPYRARSAYRALLKAGPDAPRPSGPGCDTPTPTSATIAANISIAFSDPKSSAI